MYLYEVLKILLNISDLTSHWLIILILWIIGLCNGYLRLLWHIILVRRLSIFLLTLWSCLTTICCILLSIHSRLVELMEIILQLPTSNSPTLSLYLHSTRVQLGQTEHLLVNSTKKPQHHHAKIIKVRS